LGWYINANKYDRKSHYAPLNNFHIDLDTIAEAINKKTKIIYLANPNNPIGTMFTKVQFEDFMSKVPDYVLIVLEEAYTIYAKDFPGYINGLEYDLDNLIVIGSFSKAYGLAGLRIGYGVAKEHLIKEHYKVKLPFEPNCIAQAAAIAALDDEEFLLKTIRLNKLSLQRMKEKFDELGIKYIPTCTNFYLM
jgi:histidinol-phosphate aminotransferase